MFSGLYIFAAGCTSDFLGLHPWWYYYSKKVGGCNFDNFNILGNGRPSDLPLVLLAIIDDLLRIAGMAAVVYVIYGGIKYIMSQGSPDETAKAQGTVINALIGLFIALLAVGVVSYIGNRIG